MNTLGARVKVKNGANIFNAVFINKKSGRRAIVAANPSYNESISIEVELDNYKGSFLMATPEVPESRESNGKVEIASLSAVVFMEK